MRLQQNLFLYWGFEISFPLSDQIFLSVNNTYTELFHRDFLYEMVSYFFFLGVPAAYLVTPADVIKTRLQVNNFCVYFVLFDQPFKSLINL